MKSMMAEALDRLKTEKKKNDSSNNLGLDVNNLIVINEYCSSLYDKMNEKWNKAATAAAVPPSTLSKIRTSFPPFRRTELGIEQLGTETMSKEN